VFSPYYAWARKRHGPANPLDHCAVNIALYGPGRSKRWAMTERGQAGLERSADTLRIGPSQLHWDGNALTVDLAEITVPFPSKIRGTIRVHPRGLADHCSVIDGNGQHRWQPIAPFARVDVHLDSPAIRWTGEGYFDSNQGDAPIEDSIEQWNWSRSSLRDGTAVIYDIAARNGEKSALNLRFDRHGNVLEFEPIRRITLPKTGWRIARATRADADNASVVRTLEDTPFYSRSVIHSRLYGEDTTGIHESLDLSRFRRPIVQAMLPFRMPRVRR